MSCDKPRLLSSKTPGEIITVGFDFAALTTTPSAPTITAIVHSGTADAAPQDIVTGLPQVSGTWVYQQITGGVDVCTYLLTCRVDAPDGNRWDLSALLPVCAPKPAA
jgi:hypothetical protein